MPATLTWASDDVRAISWDEFLNSVAETFKKVNMARVAPKKGVMSNVDFDYAHEAAPHQAPSPKSPEPHSDRNRWSKETYIALLALLGISAHLIFRFGFHAAAQQYNLPLILVLTIGGAPLLFDLLRRIIRREFGSDLLAGLSIAAAAALGEYLAGSIVVLMLSGGTALELYATKRASAVLAALAKRMPSVAHKLIDLRIVEISLDEIRIADKLVVFPHETCPVDGAVVEGRGTMDESF